MHTAPTMELDPTFDECDVNSNDSEHNDSLQEGLEEEDENEIEDGNHAGSFQGEYHVFMLTLWMIMLWLGLSNEKVDNLLGYFGHNGSLYEDSCVMDMLEGCPIDRPGLERLLVSIEETWMNDMGPSRGGRLTALCVFLYDISVVI